VGVCRYLATGEANLSADLAKVIRRWVEKPQPISGHPPT
jgi:hypothetical protein